MTTKEHRRELRAFARELRADIRRNDGPGRVAYLLRSAYRECLDKVEAELRRTAPLC